MKSTKDAGFTASKFFVAKIPTFDKQSEGKSQQSGQSSGGNRDDVVPLGFSSFGKFSKF